MLKSNQKATAEATFNTEAFTPFFKDFYCFADTNFAEFLTESASLLQMRPDLVVRIEADLDRHGLKKKELREADRLFLLNQTEALNGFEDLPESLPPEGPDGEKAPARVEVLETGRTRMAGFVVGVLLLVRGYHGSCTNKEALDFMGESKSLEAFFAQQDMTLPKRSTMSELLNAVSVETREAILSAQLEQAMKEELDDFKQALIDSTAAKANSCWPTDAKTIFVLLQRIFEVGRTLERVGLSNIRTGWLENFLKELSGLPFQINLNAKKKKKFRKFSRDFIEVGSKFLEHAGKELTRLGEGWKEQLNSGRMLPSLCEQARARVNLFVESLNLASKSLEQMRQRVFEDKTFPSTQRVLSVHDRSAAYIQKGGRVPVIGYKPQLARSKNGYVVALQVDEGNISDAKSLVPMVQKTITHTGVTPNLVNVDDGYSSQEGYDKLMELGVETVSISGSKGKKLLGEKWDEQEYQVARAGRSAVESLMYCLKYGFDFGQLSRTGLEAVRAEFLEKCLAYNICRTVLLRKRKRDQLKKAA